jgi:cobalt/nickel transport system permease protein
MYLIDRIAHTNRWTRRPTPEKLLLALGGLGLCLGGPTLATGPLMLVVASALALGAARGPARAYFAVLGLPVGFLLASLPMLMISVDPSGGQVLAWRTDQWPVAAALLGRASGAAACLTLLVLTTPVHAMIPGLRGIGVPAFLIEIMLLTYRLIFVVAETAAAGYAAQAARLGHVGWRRTLRSLGMLAAALFQRSMTRAQHMETGLAARGFDGNLTVLPEDAPPVSIPRCAAIVSLLAATLGCALLAERLIHV